MIEILGRIYAGNIKPRLDYEAWNIDGDIYLIGRNFSENKIIGEIVDIVSESDKIDEYRNLGYWPLKFENSNRVAIVKSLSLDKASHLKKLIKGYKQRNNKNNT